jgi:hypothetical protein
LQAIRNGGSVAPIIVFGVLPVNAGALTIENAVSAGVSAFTDPVGKTFFVPLYNRPYLPMIQGAWNNNPAPSGIIQTNALNAGQYINANDSIHPTDPGSRYIGKWLANQIRQILLYAA